MKRLNLYDLPDDVHAWLSELAKQERRSVSAQVIVLLRQCMRTAQENTHA
jgi:hypothetical protein